VPPLEFIQLPFGHPHYIMYSSGTTGLPKCMVQSAGGVLINQLKELVLHTDLRREDTIFYFTTCGWMMWNWLTCSLGVGATLMLFDGNPFHPNPGALWKMAEDHRVTVFGTSAGYIAALINAGVQPRKQYDLSAIRAVLSTGSPLSVEGFRVCLQGGKGRPAAGLHLRRIGHQRLFFRGEPHGARLRRGTPVQVSRHEGRILRQSGETCPEHAG